jgi:hypothetical protein
MQQKKHAAALAKYINVLSYKSPQQWEREKKKTTIVYFFTFFTAGEDEDGLGELSRAKRLSKKPFFCGWGM